MIQFDKYYEDDKEENDEEEGILIPKVAKSQVLNKAFKILL